MLFSASIFWIFYGLVLALLQVNYKVIKSVPLQTFILLTASYYFYGSWDWRCLGLIILVSAQTYWAAYIINTVPNYKKIMLAGSIFINLVILAYFKYSAFFVTEFMAAFGLEQHYGLENIILPVGISFYIFQSFTYVLDVFYGRILPEKDPLKYFTFIAFFPQLVAGPIERASSLLPQFHSLKGIDVHNIYAGLKIIIIGLFLKIFIADYTAILVDIIFKDYQNHNSATLLLGGVGFAIQIYGDFAGYSFIAIGVAKIMGFSLMQNFNTPYFAVSPQDFWRRWHISLSTFFKDYVYIPLGGNRLSELKTNRNLIITFFVSGLWHGANWTFILWGFLHGLLLSLQRLTPIKSHKVIGWCVTMMMIVILWILFRSETLADFYHYMALMMTHHGLPEAGKGVVIFAFYAFLLDILLFKYHEKDTWFSCLWLEVTTLAVMLICVLGALHDDNQNFIYFQF